LWVWGFLKLSFGGGGVWGGGDVGGGSATSDFFEKARRANSIGRFKKTDE
jgi:hypothetical protein